MPGRAGPARAHRRQAAACGGDVRHPAGVDVAIATAIAAAAGVSRVNAAARAAVLLRERRQQMLLGWRPGDGPHPPAPMPPLPYLHPGRSVLG